MSLEFDASLPPAAAAPPPEPPPDQGDPRQQALTESDPLAPGSTPAQSAANQREEDMQLAQDPTLEAARNPHPSPPPPDGLTHKGSVVDETI